MKLSEREFKTTMGSPMRRFGPEAEPPVDFWPYFEAIPLADFEGHNCTEGSVTYVWEHPEGRYQHVLVNSEDKNIFMALVLSVKDQLVLGHHLLDLNREYGVSKVQPTIQPNGPPPAGPRVKFGVSFLCPHH